MKTRIALVSAVLLLALTGCAGTVGDDTSAQEDAAPTVETTPAETPEPLVAEKSNTATADAAELEAAYLVTVRERLSKIDSQIPNATDQQLIDAAYEACELMNDTDNTELSLIEGEEKTHGYYMDSDAIKIAARMNLCPLDS